MDKIYVNTSSNISFNPHSPKISTSSKICIVPVLNNDLAQQPEFVYDATGKITGYKTPGGADTVFPFNLLNEITVFGTSSSMSGTSYVKLKNLGYKSVTLTKKTELATNIAINGVRCSIGVPVDVSSADELTLSIMVTSAGYGNPQNTGTGTFALS